MTAAELIEKSFYENFTLEKDEKFKFNYARNCFNYCYAIAVYVNEDCNTREFLAYTFYFKDMSALKFYSPRLNNHLIRVNSINKN